MKILSGKYKNKKLFTLKGDNTRPTTSRIKEDIFNILNNYFTYENKIAIDIFAGCGALGIEALSRGIKYCYFNDKSNDAYKIVLKNLNLLKSKDYKLYKMDYISFLRKILISKQKIDLIFLDPPFREHSFYFQTLNFISKFDLLNVNGIIVIETNFEIIFDKDIEFSK